MQHATHARAARTVTRRLAWLALGLVAATLMVIQVARHGTGALALAVVLAVPFGLRTPAGFQRG